MISRFLFKFSLTVELHFNNHTHLLEQRRLIYWHYSVCIFFMSIYLALRRECEAWFLFASVACVHSKRLGYSRIHTTTYFIEMFRISIFPVLFQIVSALSNHMLVFKVTFLGNILKITCTVYHITS